MISTKMTKDFEKIRTGWVKAILEEKAKKILHIAGHQIAKLSKQNIELSGTLFNMPFAPNSPYTIAKKHSNKPLIETGVLKNTITVKELNKNSVFIQASSIKNGKDVAKQLEEGFQGILPSGRIFIVPPRPYLSPVLTSTIVKKSIIHIYRTNLLSMFKNNGKIS